MTDLVTELDATRDLLHRSVGKAFALAGRQKSRDVHSLTLSALGRCTRQSAYKLAGTTPSDPPTGEGEQRAAMLGTWVHRGLLPRLRLILSRSRTEMKVTLAAAGIHLEGQADLYVRHGIVDLKTVREHGLSHIRQWGPRPADKAQVRGYALAAIQQGRPVKWVAYVYMDRATGEHETFVEPFTASDAMRVLDRVSEIVAASKNLRMAPRDEKGPGLSVVCDSCPWLRSCWGRSARPGDVGAQGGLSFRAPDVVDEEAAGTAAELYARSRAAAAQAKADQDFARSLLSWLPEGAYGRWKLKWGKPSRAKPDPKAMEARLRELGELIPMTGGGTSTISVDPMPLEGAEPAFANGTADSN